MSINSPQNIQLLKQLLQENSLNKINPQYFDKVFTSQLNSIHENRFKHKSNLVSMNKILLANMEEFSKKYNMQNNYSSNSSLNSQYSTFKLNPRPQQDDPFIEPNESTPKITILEKKYQEKKENFDTLNIKPKPKEVDFTDNIKETIINDDDYDMKMKQREAELTEIMNQQSNKTNNDWLKGENTLTDARKYNQDNEKKNKFLEPQSPEPQNFDSNISLEKQNDNSNNNKKKVRFNMTEPLETNVSNNFFNKLKTVNDDVKERNNINNIITEKPEFINHDKILSNQDKILANQDRILSNQDKILSNQDKILANSNITTI